MRARGLLEFLHDVWHVECHYLIDILVNAFLRPKLTHFYQFRTDLCYQYAAEQNFHDFFLDRCHRETHRPIRDSISK